MSDTKEHERFAAEVGLRIADLEREIAELRLVQQYHDRMAGSVSREGGNSAPAIGNGKHEYAGPSDAVRAYLSKHPRSSSAEVCNAIVGKFPTTANPKVIVYSTLASLEKREKATSQLIGGVKRFTLIDE